MWQFECNLVTLKNDNRIGDLVGVILKKEDGHKKGFSLEELENLVKENKTTGLKLVPYTVNKENGEREQGGHLVFFEDDRPLMLSKIRYHKEVSEKEAVIFTPKLKEAIIDSVYR